MSESRCFAPACQSSVWYPTRRARKINSSESAGGRTRVLRVAAHHAQTVDQHADEEVGLAQILTGGAGNEACVNQGCECAERVRCAQAGIAVAMHHLEILNGVFQRDDAAMAVLEVDLPRLNELLDLLPTQIERGRKIPRGSAIDEVVAMGFYFLPECGVPGDMTELDQCLPLERRSQPVGTVIRADFVERIGERALAAVRP
jgi:hypothetical protein